MKPARLAVLAIAVVTGGAAAFLMRGDDAPPAAVQGVAAPPAVATAEVLVAAVELPLGQVLQAADLRWQSWPAQGITPGYITRTQAPKGLDEAVGALVRSDLLAGEPIRREKLARSDGGYLAAILPAGMRAIAITIDARGSTSAGGFVLPNDHVDLLRTFRDEEATRAGNGDVQITETLLSDVRVLAIGPLLREKNGTSVVVGETATLALTPSQTELVTLAQKAGQISLALRSLADTGRATEATAEPPRDAALTVVRFGVSKQQARH